MTPKDIPHMKTTATLSLSLILAIAGASAAFADTQTTVITTTTVAPVAVVRDGRPDGVIIVPGKMNKTLHSGDWLGFDGTLTRGDSGRVEHLQPDL